MKQVLLFFRWVGFAVLALFLLTSCGDNRSAKRVAKSFLQSYYVNDDFEAAKKVSTESTYETLDFKAMMFELNPNSESDSIREFKINRMEVKKTKAVCFYEVIGSERRLNLSKVNGKWFVDMPERTLVEPGLSLSQSSGTGGFASAQSEPIQLKNAPDVSSENSSK
jgi:hypothetical protein